MEAAFLRGGVRPPIETNDPLHRSEQGRFRRRADLQRVADRPADLLRRYVTAAVETVADR